MTPRLLVSYLGCYWMAPRSTALAAGSLAAYNLSDLGVVGAQSFCLPAEPQDPRKENRQLQSQAIMDQAQHLQQRIVDLRRRIHRRPELGFREVRTSRLVADTLEELGIEAKTGIGKTGVVGYLGREGPTIALRADMDALAIEEQNDVSYASEVPGVMHACGHDAHTAMLLGAAMLLSKVQLAGQVRLLFQPCEEGTDEEGKSGAMRMVDDGGMDGVDAVIGLHVDPRLATGSIKVGEGAVCAAADSFRVKIIGEGCHGAYPHLGVDPIYISAQVITALQSVVSRRVDPTSPSVMTVGFIRGGTMANIIPAEVELRGTIRSLDEEVREQLWQELRTVLETSRALGGDFSLEIKEGYPVLVNDARVAALVRDVSTEFLGAENVHKELPEMGAEDFAIFASRAPGAMFSLGVKPAGREKPLRLHSPDFDLDEEALPLGSALLVGTALRFLAEGAL
jgi:amidohydrolase